MLDKFNNVPNFSADPMSSLCLSRGEVGRLTDLVFTASRDQLAAVILTSLSACEPKLVRLIISALERHVKPTELEAH